MSVKKLSVLLLSAFLVFICVTGAMAVSMELKWDLSKEQRQSEDKSEKWRVSTTSGGWEFEVRNKNFVAVQGFKLPSKSRYLFYYETEAELFSLEGRSKAGISMGIEGIQLMFEINDSETQIRVAKDDSVWYVTKGKLPKKLNPPLKIKMTYNVESGEVEGFVDGELAINGNCNKLPNLPNITSINRIYVAVGTMYDSDFARGVYKTVEVKGH